MAGTLLLAAGIGCTGGGGAGPEAPVGRYSAVGALSADGAALYLVGGGAEEGVLADAWRLDLSTLAWTRLSDAPEPMLRGTAVRDGEALLIFGGEGEDWTDSDRLWRWDLGLDTWTLLDEGGGPSPRKKHAAVMTSQGMLVHGGHHNDVDPALVLGDAWLWSTQGWRALTDDEAAPVGAYRQGLAWDEEAGVAWVHGGYDETDARTDRLWRLTLAEARWEEVTWTGEGPAARASHALAVAPGEVLGSAGAGLVAWGGHATDDSAWAFDPARSTWVAHPASPAPLPRDAQVTDLSPDGRTLYLACGDPVEADVADFVCDVWALSLPTRTWTELVPAG